MKKFTRLLMACLLPLTAQQVCAQTYNMQDYNDVKINWVNRETAVAVTLPEDRYQQYLNGTWKFNWSPDPDKAPKNFWDQNYNVNGWDDITVPMPWQVYAYQRTGTIPSTVTRVIPSGTMVTPTRCRRAHGVATPTTTT